MATAEVGRELESLRPKLMRWAGLAVLVGIALLLVARVSDFVIRQFPNNATTVQNGVWPAHCTQFIVLAKAKFGPDWKYRLDPRDMTCAQQIQQEWEHQWNARQDPSQLQQPTMPISAPVAPPTYSAPSPADARLRNPETYCLNVISLARARYGADWAQKVGPAEAANCGAEIQKSAIQ